MRALNQICVRWVQLRKEKPKHLKWVHKNLKWVQKAASWLRLAWSEYQYASFYGNWNCNSSEYTQKSRNSKVSTLYIWFCPILSEYIWFALYVIRSPQLYLGIGRNYFLKRILIYSVWVTTQTQLFLITQTLNSITPPKKSGSGEWPKLFRLRENNSVGHYPNTALLK